MPGLRGTPAVMMTTSEPAQSRDLRVVSEDCPVLLEVERLALGDTFLLGNVEEDDVAELVTRAERGQLAADVAGANQGNLVPTGHLQGSFADRVITGSR
jgi:hypothetical protein